MLRCHLERNRESSRQSPRSLPDPDSSSPAPLWQAQGVRRPEIVPTACPGPCNGPPPGGTCLEHLTLSLRE
ncbi:hypothetical protein ATANTOWER_022979 [Ataeniobius toweri]|uniref:Uncharacterized protein n=1 Tax=Ataeniobius toweri TaxID=208326 RepID=A0ABU7AH05_9TELE|nr:hypothetical protein [Ataeniobius toweri]